MAEFREPVKSFTKAQMNRIEAFEDGEYELDDEEGFECESCGWRGLSAPMADEKHRDIENNLLLECPECGEPNPSSGDLKIEYYQNFGYEYRDFPRNIPRGKEEEYKI